MLLRALLRRRRAALVVALGPLLAGPLWLIGQGSSQATALSSCGYLSASEASVTATTVPLTTFCATCPPDSDWEGPTGYHDNLTAVSVYVCVTPGL